jgi:hypothetical protein
MKSSSYGINKSIAWYDFDDPPMPSSALGGTCNKLFVNCTASSTLSFAEISEKKVDLFASIASLSLADLRRYSLHRVRT